MWLDPARVYALAAEKGEGARSSHEGSGQGPGQIADAELDEAGRAAGAVSDQAWGLAAS